MKPIKEPIPELSANKSLLFLATKQISGKMYSEDKTYNFVKGEEVILNDYPMVSYAFREIVGIPNEAVSLVNVNQKLFEIIEIINPIMFSRILEDISTYNFVSTGDTTNQAIFRLAYGYLQAVQVYELQDNGSRIPLIKLDEKYVKEW